MIKFYSLFGGTLSDTVLIHPEGLNYLKKQIETLQMYNLIYGMFSPSSILGGLEIITDVNIPKHPRKWLFPVTPFTTYEESDELWARPVCFGREVEDVNSYACYLMKIPDYFKYMDIMPNPYKNYLFS